MNYQRSNLYTYFSIGALSLAVLAVSGYAYLSKPSVDASVNSEASARQQVGFYPLKVGDNILRSDTKILSMDSRVVSINGNLISFQKAMDRGMISSIKLINSGKILGEGVDSILPGEEFNVTVKDISLNPELYLE